MVVFEAQLRTSSVVDGWYDRIGDEMGDFYSSGVGGSLCGRWYLCDVSIVRAAFAGRRRSSGIPPPSAHCLPVLAFLMPRMDQARCLPESNTADL